MQYLSRTRRARARLTLACALASGASLAACNAAVPPRRAPTQAHAPARTSAALEVPPRNEPPRVAALPPLPAPADVAIEPPAAPACGTGGWSTYAHDGARTSASDGCFEARSPRLRWSFSPMPFAGREGRVHHPLVDDEGHVYANGLRGQSPVLQRLDDATPPGVAWTFDSRADIHRDAWPSIARVKDRAWGVVNDDGLYLLDLETGKNEDRGLDTWGMSLADGERLYAVNTWQEDGPGLFVAAYDERGKIVWKANKFGGARHVLVPDVGGICLAEGMLVHARNYRFPSHSGVSAIDPATGADRWSVSTMPESAPSAAGGAVFLVEAGKDGAADELVARALGDGARAWARPVRGARGPSPVVANGRVIVHAEDAVLAFDAGSGEPLWSAPLARPKLTVGAATTLAAALGSQTLVVVSGGQIHVLALATGAERATFDPSPARAAKEIHSPVIAGRSLFVVADGALQRFDDEEQR